MINLKKLNQNILYIPSKMEGLSFLKELLQKGSKGCIFFCCTSQNFPEICKLSMMRKSLRVSLLVLWPGTCFKNFPKTNENFDCISEMFGNSVDNLPGRHLTYGKLARGTFVLQNLKFVIDFQKSVLNPSHQIQFLGVEIDSLTMIVSFPLKKKEQIILQFQDLLNQSNVSR